MPKKPAYATTKIPLPKPTLLGEAWATLGRLPRFTQGKLMIFVIAMVLFPIGLNWIQMRMVSGTSNGLAFIFVLFKFGQWILNVLRELTLVDIGEGAETSFIRKEVERYTRFDKPTSYRHPPEKTLVKNLAECASSINRMIEWGMQSFASTAGDIIACVILFLTTDLRWYDGIIFVVFALLYRFVLTPLQGVLTERMKKHNQIRNSSKDGTPFLAHELMNKEIGHDEFSNVLTEKVVYDCRSVRPLFTYTFSSIEGAMLLVIALYAWILPSDNEFAMKYVLLSTISGAINNIAQFGTQYKRYCQEYDSYYQLFADSNLVYETPVHPLDLPRESVISGVALKRGKYTVRCPNRITVQQGGAYLIQGPSGSGKSTFLDGVMGFISGIRLKGGRKIRSYTHQMVCHLQNAQSIALPNISIKRVFRSDDTGAIRRALDIVFERDELDEILSNLSSTDPYGVLIQDRLSGGQKSRFFLALTLFKAIRKGAKIVFLDEPEQGLDPELKIKTYQRINEFAKTQRLTVFWISHLRQEELDETGIQFNNRLMLQKGGLIIVS